MRPSCRRETPDPDQTSTAAHASRLCASGKFVWQRLTAEEELVVRSQAMTCSACPSWSLRLTGQNPI